MRAAQSRNVGNADTDRKLIGALQMKSSQQHRNWRYEHIMFQFPKPKWKFRFKMFARDMAR